MRLTFISLGLLFLSTMTFAQSKMDVEFIFKSLLFLDKSMGKDSGLVKNDSLYSIYMKRVSLILHPLETEEIKENFKFYYVHANRDIQYNLTNNEMLDFFLTTNSGFTDGYIICVETKSQTAYRIKGFDGNDFLQFFNEHQDQSYDTDREFFKYAYVEGIDLKCLYKELRKKRINRRNIFKCPSIGRVSDGVWVN